MLRDFSNSAIAVFGFSWGITCVDSFWLCPLTLSGVVQSWSFLRVFS
jgi:hypothetical protein